MPGSRCLRPALERERRVPGQDGNRAPLASVQTLRERRGALDRLRTRIGELYLRSEQLRGFVLLSPALAITLLLLAVPLGIVIAYRFWTKTSERYEAFLMTANFENLVVHPAYPLLLGKSLLISLCVAEAAVGLAYPSQSARGGRLRHTRAATGWESGSPLTHCMEMTRPRALLPVPHSAQHA